MSMVPNNFSINIARARGAGTAAGAERGWDGKPVYAHFAAVELGQMMEEIARARFAVFCERFPASDGFKLTLSRIECSGRDIASS
jgi:hypothetical protein